MEKEIGHGNSRQEMKINKGKWKREMVKEIGKKEIENGHGKLKVSNRKRGVRTGKCELGDRQCDVSNGNDN